jgi:hypothetical protein
VHKRRANNTQCLCASSQPCRPASENAANWLLQPASLQPASVPCSQLATRQHYGTCTQLCRYMYKITPSDLLTSSSLDVHSIPGLPQSPRKSLACLLSKRTYHSRKFVQQTANVGKVGRLSARTRDLTPRTLQQKDAQVQYIEQHFATFVICCSAICVIQVVVRQGRREKEKKPCPTSAFVIVLIDAVYRHEAEKFQRKSKPQTRKVEVGASPNSLNCSFNS